MATFPSFKPLIDEAKAQEHLAELKTRYEELAKEMKALERAREAATAYLDIFQGRRRFAPQPEPQDKTTRTRASRGEMGGVQKLIVDCVTNYQPDGAKAEAINRELKDSGYNAKQIAAALFRMKRDGILSQAQARAAYTLGPNAPRAATPLT